MVIEFGDPIDFVIPITNFPDTDPLLERLARNARIKVFMLVSAHDQMIEHVNSDRDIECGGVLVGYPFNDGQTQQTFVVIVGIIPDVSDDRSLIHFTVTPETIAQTRQIMEDKFPNLIAVGWYHSHPGHGVFLSGQDMTIVRSIYNQTWNLAWVIDPQRNQEGIFYGINGEPIITNKSSHPLLHENKIWIPLLEYPDCIKNLQLDRSVRIDTINTDGVSDVSQALNREIELISRREQILNRRKMPCFLRSSIVMFVLSLLATGYSLYNPFWSLYAILISEITAFFGIYVMSSNRRRILTDKELRKFAVMQLVVACFLIIGIINYLTPYQLK